MVKISNNRRVVESKTTRILKAIKLVERAKVKAQKAKAKARSKIKAAKTAIDASKLFRYFNNQTEYDINKLMEAIKSSAEAEVAEAEAVEAEAAEAEAAANVAAIENEGESMEIDESDNATYNQLVLSLRDWSLA